MGPSLQLHAEIADVASVCRRVQDLALFGGTMIFRHGEAVGALVALALVTASCASVIEGKSQQIFVNTNPPGADCGLYREQGVRIGTIQNTPSQVLIEKTKNDIYIVCVKSGYQQAMVRDHSGVAGAAFVNIIGGVFTLGISTVIGAAVDSSNGSDNKYESPVNISMVPNVAGQPEGPTVLPRTYDLAHSEPGDPQQAVTTSVGSEPSPASAASSEPPADRTSNRRKNRSASSSAPPQITAGPSLSAGVWLCVIDNIGNKNNPRFTLQFNIAPDNAITVVSYSGAPTTIVQHDPLIFTSLNPNGARQTKFTWRADNSMTITGPTTSDPNRYFYNEGTCSKAS